MNVCLLSLSYPPQDTHGIARQREALASSLVKCGHKVQVITLSDRRYKHVTDGVEVCGFVVPRVNRYSSSYSDIEIDLTRSQAMYEGLLAILNKKSFDIIDIPLWGIQSFITLSRYTGPSVLWLQTTFAQLMQIDGRKRSSSDIAHIELDRRSIVMAKGVLADSQNILDRVGRNYNVQLDQPTGVAHLGLPNLEIYKYNTRRSAGLTTALVVGRLEQRKGTPFLFDALPSILERWPHLLVRIVGQDNSANDGWFRRTGLTYPAYFAYTYPHLTNRVTFEGYVPEAILQQYYQTADFLLVPSQYESFGLTYIEAMRSGLAIITTDIGVTSELFPHGEEDGALIYTNNDKQSLIEAIHRLISHVDLCREVGINGRANFLAHFTDDQMAEATTSFYKRVIEFSNKPNQNTENVYQIMEALDYGDAVSNIAQDTAKILAQLGQPQEILSRYVNSAVSINTLSIGKVLDLPKSGIIFHYWGYNSSSWVIHAVNGAKAMYYHNITPPHFFALNSKLHEELKRGYNQLAAIADFFDLFIGDSQYNLNEISHYLKIGKPSIVIHPIVDSTRIQSEFYDKDLFNDLNNTNQVNIIFIGRVARNKRHENVMRAFEYYNRNINRHSKLWLVGNDKSDEQYRIELEKLRQSLLSGANIHFTGKVTNSIMNAYLRAADLFLCASEHEGFCVPVAQAMAMDIPVIAYSAAAMPETLGNSGVLITDWITEQIGELMHLLINDESLRNDIILKQQLRLQAFSVDQALLRLKSVVDYMQSGKLSPLIKQISPHN